MEPRNITYHREGDVALIGLDRPAKRNALSDAMVEALPRIQDLAHDDGLFFESLMAATTQTSPEALERLRAFLGKRAERLAIPEESREPG